MALDSSALRRQFPVFDRFPSLCYLDSAATAQKPQAVLDAVSAALGAAANVHRGLYRLAEEATDHYEQARATVQTFLHARSASEMVFTKSCTEAVNLVARCWAAEHARGGTIVVTELEHHSNIVPWLQLQEEGLVNVVWWRCDAEGHLAAEDLAALLRQHDVRLVAVTGQSNVLGVHPDLAAIIREAHAVGAKVLVDAAQYVVHSAIDVQSLDCDFLTFSAHKLYGPTGIGVLYGKSALLQSMRPWLGGGGMMQEVHDDGYTPADIPARFEGGTPAVAEAAGLAAAIDWLSGIDRTAVLAHECALTQRTVDGLAAVAGCRVLSPAGATGCVSFVIDGVHPHDLADIVGREDVCLRAGHHCAQPLHRRLGIAASTRLSVGIYTLPEEIDRGIAAIDRAASFLRR